MPGGNGQKDRLSNRDGISEDGPQPLPRGFQLAEFIEHDKIARCYPGNSAALEGLNGGALASRYRADSAGDGHDAPLSSRRDPGGSPDS